MGKKLDLNYFTGQEADQFNFIKIPKPLLYDPIYADLKIAEIITYSRMLDRMNLSIKNGWFDELGRAYIFCSLADVREFAKCTDLPPGTQNSQSDGHGFTTALCK